jgi:hypothetical protein
MTSILSETDEARLRNLATGLARQIEDPAVLLKRLGFTSEDYQELSESRIFKTILTQAITEWEGAANTHKRVKLKAAVNVEESLPSFYQAMTNPKEPLSSRVKALEIITRIAGLGMNEPVPIGNGQFFKLQINLGGGLAPLVIANASPIIENEDLEEAPVDLQVASYSQSKLFDDLPLEDF